MDINLIRWRLNKHSPAPLFQFRVSFSLSFIAYIARSKRPILDVFACLFIIRLNRHRTRFASSIFLFFIRSSPTIIINTRWFSLIFSSRSPNIWAEDWYAMLALLAMLVDPLLQVEPTPSRLESTPKYPINSNNLIIIIIFIVLNTFASCAWIIYFHLFLQLPASIMTKILRVDRLCRQWFGT